MPSTLNSSIRPDPPDASAYRELVRRALAEDVGSGDVTTASTVPAAATAQATLVAKQPCVVAGLDVAREVFAQIDSAVRFEPLRADGEACDAGALLARISGPARAILTGERTALNFLQHLSGIATRTRAFVDAAGGRVTLLDTRKTIPTLRALAKYAVRCGGGRNHRMGLFDAALIKDNHTRLAGGVLEAVRRVRRDAPGLEVEVEAQSLEEVRQAVEAGADIIMLDNLSDEAMRQAVALIAGRARVEISGGVTLERMPALAALGADYVSVGGVTHSAPAVDISLEVEENRAG
jgi:nicotinate-nucleotide pyrophosphorylase (carboxylating)